MKENLSRMLRSGVAMLLVLCMVAGFVPTAVFAAEVKDGNGDGIINYVSFGASNVNGYGLSGYLDADVTAGDKADKNVYGYQRMPVGSYPYLIAEALNKAGSKAEGYTGALNGTKGKQPFANVHVDQLAMSSMRMEELRFLLDDTYPGDKYTDWRFYDVLGDGDPDEGNWFGKAEDDIDALRNVYQNAIKNADVITLDMGINNFGVFMDRAMSHSVDIDINAIDPEIAAQYAQAKAFVKQTVAQYSGEAALLLEGMDHMIDSLAFTLVGFCTSFDVVMGKIQELNPDATVVVVSIQNLLTGLSLEMPGFEQTLPLDQIFGAVINAANLYTAGRSPYRDSYLYTDVRKSGRVNFFIDDLLAYNGNPSTLTQNMIDCYNVYDDDLHAEKNIRAMVDAFVAGQIEKYFDDTDVGILAKSYDITDPENELDKLLSKFLEDGANHFATVRGTLSALLPLDSPQIAVATKKYEDVYKTYNQMKDLYTPLALNVGYDVLTEIFREGVEDHTLSFAALSSSIKGDVEDNLLAEIGGVLQTAVAGLAAAEDKENYNFDINEAYPDGFFETLAAKGLDAKLVKTIACMGIRTGIGNSFYGHPTPYGHEQIANAILKTMEEDITGDEVVKEEVKIVLSELYDLIQKYGPDAAKQVWAQWEAQGYVAAVESSINNVINAAKFRYAYYTESVLPAIDAAIADLNAEKDALVVELATLNALLAAKEAELADVLAKQEIGSVTVPEINFDITAEVGGNTPSTVPGYDCEAGEGAVAELNAAIADLKHAIAVVEALIADAGADVADMAALAAQIATAIAPLGETVEEIVAAGEDLLEAFWAIREVLTNDSAAKTVETVVSVFNSARSTALAATKVVELTGTAASLAFDDIDAMVDMVIADAEALAAKIVADIPASLANAPEEVLAAVAVAKIVADIARTTAGDYVEGAIDAQIEALIADATAKYEAGKADLEAHIIEKSAVVEGILAQLDAHVAAKFPGVKAEAEKQFAALIVMKADLEAELQALKADLEAKVIALANETEATIEAAIAPIKAQIARVEKDLATIENDLTCAVEHLAAAKEALVVYVNELVISVNDQVKNTISGIVTEMKETVIAMGENALAELVDLVVTGINKLLMQATTTDLVVDDDFTYVALGDGSAAADSYVELLAALLGDGALANGVNAIDFVNAAKTGNTVIGVRENLPAEVATADLITLGFSNVNFLANAFINVGTERDWAKLVGEENVPYVMELLAEVEAKIAEAGLSGDMAATVNSIIEGFAYCNVEYAVELPKLISNIKAVNPDAVIVIVGMYNPLKDATLVVEGATIEISEYIDYLVEGTAIHGLVYSLISGDSIYVNVGDVATLNTKTELGMADLTSLVATGFAPLNPSAAGHETIMAYLAYALNVTYVPTVVEPEGILGDADNDGVVTLLDAQAIMKMYVGEDVEVNLDVCDLNGDGVVGLVDAQLIMQLYVGLIEKFPVEQ